jgi:hypothetical protein
MSRRKNGFVVTAFPPSFLSGNNLIKSPTHIFLHKNLEIILIAR